MSAPEFDTAILDLARFYLGDIPHIRELGMELVQVGRGDATMRLPYRADLVGDPESGVLHGGAVTVLIDSVCGLAVLSAMRNPGPIATLDLRIDYLRPARVGYAVQARAECFRLTHQIAFVRSTAFHDDPRDPVAAAQASFVIKGEGGGLAADGRSA
jgi:uncharacterized protein (TIGR00369 family)